MPRLVNLVVKPAEYDEPLPEVLALRLYQELSTHHSFEVEVLFDHLEGKTGSFMSTAHEKLVGKLIHISIIEDQLTDLKHKFYFSGLVTSLVMNSSNDYTGSFLIKGYSSTCLLTDGVQKRTFQNKTLDNIVRDTVDPNSPNLLKITYGQLRHTAPIPYVVQYEENNFDFLNRLLASYQEWFYYDGTELLVGPPATADTTPVFMDGYWSHFQLEAAVRPAQISLYAYDSVHHEQLQGKAPDPSSSLGNSTYAKFAVQRSRETFPKMSHLLTGAPVTNQSELLAQAEALSQSSAATGLTLRGRTDNPNLRLGQLIDATAQGLGSTVTRTDNLGKYRIVSLHHEVDEEGNYRNSFTAVPYALLLPPPNLTALPPMAQPELAEVFDLNDPKKLGRVRVRFHWPLAKEKDTESDWLRVSTPYAGQGKGLLFTPEIGSQVFIAYEHGRADRPFVLGNLLHANNPQKASYSAPDNTIKGIQTAGGNKITFHDKKGKEKILISNGQKKETKLEISFARDGAITLRTKGMIALEADGKIILDGKDILIEASGQLELKGESVSIEATNRFKVESNSLDMAATTTAQLAGNSSVTVKGATAELSASMLASVKGTIVKIN